jgi:uncharacterized phiE125 gp8 family phage protein
MAGLVVVTAPTSEPITVSDLITHLRLDADTDEVEMEAYIQMAREWCENYTGRAFVNRTLRLSLDGLSDVDDALWEGWKIGPDMTLKKRDIKLPKPPLVSVTSVTTYDDADVPTVFSSASYYVDNAAEPGRVVLRTGSTWPTALRVGNAVEIVYVAGYGAAAAVPAPIKFACKAIAAWMYENRGEQDYAKMPANATALLQSYRVMSFGTDPYGSK